MRKGNIVLGTIFIGLGIIIILALAGVFKLGNGFLTYWPILLILLGIALYYSQKWIASLLVLALVVLAVIYVAERMQPGPYRTLQESLDANNVQTAQVNISYGAGQLNITSGSENYVVYNKAMTTDSKDPVLKQDGASITLKRAAGVPFGNQDQESWHVELSPKIHYGLRVDYGAANANIDLRGLEVAKLEIHTGASNEIITLGPYPTNMTFASGANDATFRIPKDYGVSITVDSGLTNLKFPGFAQNGKTYTSNYVPGQPNIEIRVHTGVSTISTETY